MDSRLAFISFFLIIFSFSSPLLSADDTAPPECATKLLVCEPYLKKPDNPPASCCTPLKELIANELDCLCGLFKNQDLLKLINVTMEQALQLPKACGVKGDVSLCDKGSHVPVPAAAPKSPPSVPSTNGTVSPAGNSTKSSASSKNGKIGSGGAAVTMMAFLMALFV